MVKVKVCGITNPHDALMAIELGADALGFIFAPSPRRISPEKARDIIRSIPPFAKTVGVFVNEELTTIRRIADYCSVDLIQLHGNEHPDICLELMPRAIKAFRIKDKLSLESVRAYYGTARAFLLDTYSEEREGGTGKTFNWDLAIKGKGLGVPIILSGGLRPSNIQRAILTVQPYAVDVNSGIEESTEKKDPLLLKTLMKKIEMKHSGGLLDD